MNYRQICSKVMNLSSGINDVFLIDTQSRLLAFTAREDNAVSFNEAKFAERLEDLSFIITASKHYEQAFDTLEYIEISYKTHNTVLFPLGNDKILVICVSELEMDLKHLAARVSELIHEKARIIED